MGKRFTLEISCNSDHFEGDVRIGIADILDGVSERLCDHPTYGDFYETIFDCNGNDIGRCKIIVTEE